MSSESNSERAAFTFQSSGWDLIRDYTDSTLSKVTQDIGAPVVDDFLTFAQQLQDTDLAICSPDDFESIGAGDPIGYGATMTVFKCLWKSRSKVVAVKRINLGVPLGKSMLEVHEEEYRHLLKSLFLELRVMNHPWFKSHLNFIDLFGVVWDRIEGDEAISSFRPSLVVELADQETPTLKDFVSCNKGPLSNEQQQLVFDLLTDAAEGVTMLHTTKIVHGDLKPENILLIPGPRRLVAKLSDFGFCSPFIESRDRIGGTFYWNAPECMPSAPLTIKPFAKTLTRDLYSYGLVMWFCLFPDMPYGTESTATESAVCDWKLNQNTTAILREHIITHAPSLKKLNSPVAEELEDDSTTHDMLWFQIWDAMTELLKMQPNERNISLGVIHHVFKAPCRKADIFISHLVRTRTGEVANRVDDSSGVTLIRPTQVAGMNEALKSIPVSKYDPYSLIQLPAPLQKFLLQTWEENKNSTDKSAPQYPDLIMVVASCYRIGFGVQQDLVKAGELEVEAAQHGSDVGQIKALQYSLLDGLDLPISAEEKVAWLKRALSLILFPGTRNSDTVAMQDRFRAAVDAVPDSCVEISLLHSFIKSYMDDWEVLNGDFDGGAEDDLFGLVVKGDLESLKEKLSSDMKLLLCRKAGHTLLHVAADYCHQEIIRELIQQFNISPNIESDDGTTPIEMAAITGSVECLHLLLSLGADSQPLADQDLFTSVAMTGSRVSKERSTATGNRTILTICCGAVERVHPDESTPGELHPAVQDLLNGRYQVKEEDIRSCGSPLELCISVSNYDSVLALLALGANPNSFNYTPPLHTAVALREPILTALLLSYGADPDLKAYTDDNQVTALHHADPTSLTAFYEPPRNQVTSYTEFAKDGVEHVDTDSEPAIAARVQACISVLHFFGADIEARDGDGDTPLVLRILDDDFSTAEYLLGLGADLHSKDDSGREVVEKVDSPEGVRWCVEHGATLKENVEVGGPGRAGGLGELVR